MSSSQPPLKRLVSLGNVPRRRADSVGDSELDKLVELGFSRQTVDRLLSAGVKTIRHILLFNAEELQELLGSPDTELPRRLINAARELLAESPIATTAKERIEALGKVPTLKTGVEGLDNAIGGLDLHHPTNSPANSGLVRPSWPCRRPLPQLVNSASESFTWILRRPLTSTFILI
ncbi:hypothetical protein [Vulcanisaeta sp. JCM 14467]